MIANHVPVTKRGPVPARFAQKHVEKTGFRRSWLSKCPAEAFRDVYMVYISVSLLKHSSPDAWFGVGRLETCAAS
jgi:hypothetical protein